MLKKSVLVFAVTVLLILFGLGCILYSSVHFYGEIRELAPTCTEDGRTYRTCRLCGKTEYVRTVPALSHSFGETVRNIRYETAHAECVSCGKIENRPYIPPDGIARLYIVGTPGGTLIPVSFRYFDGAKETNGYAEVSVNGSVDRVTEKPDYNLSLYSDYTFEQAQTYDFGEAVGAVSACTLRADYYDASGGAMNLASGVLWEQTVAARQNTDANIASLPHKGAGSGKAILLYTNGNFKGIYTLCVPDDETLFGFSDGNPGALLYTHTLFGDAPFSAEIGGETIPITVKYAQHDDAERYVNGFRSMLEFVTNADENAFARRIEQYLDIDTAVDYMAYIYALNLHDLDVKGCHFTTYDGKKWIISPYAVENMFGYGKIESNIDLAIVPTESDGTVQSGLPHVLFDRLLTHYADRIALRYRELRSGVLSGENIKQVLSEKMDTISSEILDAEYAEYPAKKSVGEPIYDIGEIDFSTAFAADRFFGFSPDEENT